MAYAEAIAALADPTRRAVFERLRGGPAPRGRSRPRPAPAHARRCPSTSESSRRRARPRAPGGNTQFLQRERDGLQTSVTTSRSSGTRRWPPSRKPPRKEQRVSQQTNEVVIEKSVQVSVLGRGGIPRLHGGDPHVVAPFRRTSRTLENAQTVVLEGRGGGRMFERTPTGEHVWGTIVAWEPPNRLGYTWHPGRDEESAQEVEVLFTPEGDVTRVDLRTGVGRSSATAWRRSSRLRRGLGPRHRQVRGAWPCLRARQTSSSGKRIDVAVPVATAFRVFTEQAGGWWLWRRSRSAGGGSDLPVRAACRRPSLRAAPERRGARLGRDPDLGPTARLVFTWHPGPGPGDQPGGRGPILRVGRRHAARARAPRLATARRKRGRDPRALRLGLGRGSRSRGGGRWQLSARLCEPVTRASGDPPVHGRARRRRRAAPGGPPRRHREAEPLLPARFAEANAAQEEVTAAWQRDGALGRCGRSEWAAGGFLIGAPRDDVIWGENVWVEAAGHAVEDAEDARDLFLRGGGRPRLEEGGTATTSSCPARAALPLRRVVPSRALAYSRHTAKCGPGRRDRRPATRGHVEIREPQEEDIEALVAVDLAPSAGAPAKLPGVLRDALADRGRDPGGVARDHRRERRKGL